MDIWNSLSGMVELELTSADIGAALTAVNRENIPVFSIRYQDELTARFFLRRKDRRAVEELCTRRGDSLRLLGFRGLHWAVMGLLRRRVLFMGLCLILALTVYLPRRVLFVRVEGNSQISTRQILAAAEECGIRFGAQRRQVRSEKMKNALLAALPRLQWACVNTTGCLAVISVREDSRLPEEPQQPQVGSIVACTDGIIESCTAVSGNLLVRPGQAVKEGQLLISGYSDHGLLIRATRASGEVYAETSRRVRAVTPVQWLKKAPTGKENRRYSLVIGKKRINLCNSSRISDTTCDRIYEQYAIVLPGDFRLPVSLCVERYIPCETSRQQLSPSDAQEALSAFADRYLLEQTVAGSIVQPSCSFLSQGDIYTLDGRYICTEMIGRLRPEEIGEGYGKND